MGEPVRSLKPSAAKPSGPSRSTPPPQKSVAREYVEALVIALLLAVVIRTFFVQAYKIPSGSMEPTLLVGDHILVNKLIYGLRMPDTLFGIEIGSAPFGRYLFRIEPIHHGDVVVFVFPPDPTKDFIKRVIGLPGDTIAVKNGKVWLNGAPMPDPHAHFEVSDSDRSAVSPRDNFPQIGTGADTLGAVTVPPGKIFVMGDNRDRSYDSRFWGFVPEDNVEGRAMIIYWSWDAEGSGILPIRWSRFGMIVH
ncbi:MAG: signal peptidase I [Candidatus Binataceae bacterium]